MFSLLYQGEEEVEMSSTELLYQGILPSLPQYMVCTLCLFVWVYLLALGGVLCKSNKSGIRVVPKWYVL